MKKPLVLSDLVGLKEELVAHVARIFSHTFLFAVNPLDVHCQSRSHLVPKTKNWS